MMMLFTHHFVRLSFILYQKDRSWVEHVEYFAFVMLDHLFKIYIHLNTSIPCSVDCIRVIYVILKIVKFSVGASINRHGAHINTPTTPGRKRLRENDCGTPPSKMRNSPATTPREIVEPVRSTNKATPQRRKGELMKTPTSILKRGKSRPQLNVNIAKAKGMVSVLVFHN